MAITTEVLEDAWVRNHHMVLLRCPSLVMYIVTIEIKSYRNPLPLGCSLGPCWSLRNMLLRTCQPQWPALSSMVKVISRPKLLPKALSCSSAARVCFNVQGLWLPPKAMQMPGSLLTPEAILGLEGHAALGPSRWGDQCLHSGSILTPSPSCDWGHF